jgi:O-antigen/teichoic acid export membrane protein
MRSPSRVLRHRGRDPILDVEDRDHQELNASGSQVLRNMVTSYISLPISVVLGIFFTRIVLQHLGSSTYGLWVVLTSLTSYLGLLDAGVSTAAVQKVAALIAKGETSDLSTLVGTLLAFFFGSGLLAIGIVGVLIPFIGKIFHSSVISVTDERAIVLLLALSISIGFISSISTALIFGSGRGDLLVVLGLLAGTSVQAIQIVVVILGGGAVGLVAVTAGGALVGLLLTSAVARRFLPRRPHLEDVNSVLFKELVRNGLRNAAVGIIGTISYSLDALIIGLILPLRRVTPYDIALSTASLTRSLATLGTNQLFPAYAHSWANEDRAREFRLFCRAVMGSLAITLSIFIALVGFGSQILHLWLVHVPPDTYEIVVVLGVVYVLQVPGHQCFVLLTASNHNAILIRVGIPAALVNIGLTVGATFWLGPVGPAVGSLPQVLLLDFLFLPIIVCRYLGFPFFQYVRRAILPVLPVGVIAAGVVLLLHLTRWSDERLPGTACSALVVLVSLPALLPVLGFVDPELSDLLRRRIRWALRLARP